MAIKNYTYDEALIIAVTDEIKRRFSDASDAGKNGWSKLIKNFQDQPSAQIINTTVVKLSIAFAALEIDALVPYAEKKDHLFAISLSELFAAMTQYYGQLGKAAALSNLKTASLRIEMAPSVQDLNGVGIKMNATIIGLDDLQKLSADLWREICDIGRSSNAMLISKLQKGIIIAHGHNVNITGMNRRQISPVKWNDLKFEKPDKAFFSGTVQYNGIVFSLRDTVKKHKGRAPKIANSKTVILAAMAKRFKENKHGKTKRAEANALLKLYPDYTRDTIEKYIGPEYNHLVKQHSS